MFKRLSFSNEWHFYTWKLKIFKHRILYCFYLLKFKIIWTWISQIIRSQNDISFFSETTCTSQMISKFFKPPVFIGYSEVMKKKKYLPKIERKKKEITVYE